MVDIWAKIKECFQDIVTPADLKWYDWEDQSKSEPKTSKKSKKPVSPNESKR